MDLIIGAITDLRDLSAFWLSNKVKGYVFLFVILAELYDVLFCLILSYFFML